MEDLTKFEEIVLIAIWQLEDDAYGYNIRKHMRDIFKKEFTFGNLYSVLNQLDRKGYVLKSRGESTERRRGKPKIYYTISEEGLIALNESRNTYNLIWKGMTRKALKLQE